MPISLKDIKKLGKILLYTVATLLVLLITAVVLIQVSSVQTWAGHKAAEYLSKELDTRVEIGSVEIEFFKKVILNDVYVEDQQKDTLLYSEKLRVDISKFSIDEERIDIREIALVNTKAYMVKHKEEQRFNYKFIIDALVKKDTTKKSSPGGWQVNFNDIRLENVEFVYRNAHRDTSKKQRINFNDIVTRNINARISGIVIEKDTLYARIISLTGKEKSGFDLRNMSCSLRVDPHQVVMNDLLVETPNSKVATYLELNYNDYEDFDDFVERVRMNASLQPSKLHIGDLGYFASELYGNKQSITVSGDVKGKVTGFKGKNVHILFGERTEFIGDVSFIGLPDIEQTTISLDVEKLSTNKADLESIQIPPFNESRFVDVPENIALLGQVTFKGDFDGFINDFYAHGTFTTALGTVSSSIAMQQLEDDIVRYHGKIRSNQFNIGRYLDIPNMARVSIDADVKGTGLNKSDINAELKGLVKNIEYNGYNYQNATVEGTLAKNVFTGKLAVKDENVNMDFNGTVDFTQKLPKLDFISTLEYANLDALNFVKGDKGMRLSSQISINVVGDNIDNLIGRINFDNTILRQDKEVYRMSSFDLTSSHNNSRRMLRLSSDFAEGHVTGNFTVEEMTGSLMNLLSNYLPSIRKGEEMAKGKGKSKVSSNKELLQEFSFSLRFNKTADVMKLLQQDIVIAPGTEFTGSYSSSDKSLTLNGNSTALELYGTKVKNLEVDAKTTGGTLFMNTTSQQITFTDSIFMQGFALEANARQDSISFNMRWNNQGKKRYNGNISGSAVLLARNKLQAQILPSSVSIADSVWTVKNSNMIYVDSSYINVQDLLFVNGSQSLKVNGAVSKNKHDQLIVTLGNFNLSNIDALLRKSELAISGTVSGNASVSDLYDKLVFSTSLDFKTLRVNSELFRNGTVNAFWDKNREGILLNGSFQKGEASENGTPALSNILLEGTYYPNRAENSLDLDVMLQAILLSSFERYVKEYCSVLSGQILPGSKLHIGGTPKKPELTGKLVLQVKKVHINYLNTDYNFDGEVEVLIEPNSFGLYNEKIVDQERRKDDTRNYAMISGKVYHNNFQDFQVDFDINAQKFMVLNTTEAHNKLYYGKAFVSGIVNFFGYTDKITIDAAVKTERGTQFNIPLSGTSEVSEENSFITFVKRDSANVAIAKDYKVNLNGIQLNFNLEVTPDAEVQLIFDEKVGDVISGRGNGNIKMNINTLGDFNMYGDYEIASGQYLFTLQNVINKRFEIQSGSLIQWAGDPYDADINLTAIYNQPRASLHPFFPSDSTGTYKKRYQVDCNLMMTGKLMTPEIAFDIDLPTVDENTKTTVKSYMNTDAEMNRQIFALLIMNSFVTPPQLYSQGANEYASAGSITSFELLSNQLNNWLAQVSPEFDMSVNYRPSDEINSKELEVGISKKVLNDKVTINGEITISDKDQNQKTSNVVGDMDVEYKITDDGKVRVKAFNKANDNTFITEEVPYTQGVGIFYREEFNSISDLLKRYKDKLTRKKNKTETEAPPR